ncbi:E3 ubiquitin-protein ligase RNF14 [Pseudohyphozyma bogoriensis]|nr:E3 ubiquitin-protein ligase RNF14 [Pseudohyphozyma bogoriensis]
MNQQQEDELTALSAIYGSSSITTSQSAHSLTVKISLESLDIGTDKAFLVLDAVEEKVKRTSPPPPKVPKAPQPHPPPQARRVATAQAVASSSAAPPQPPASSSADGKKSNKSRNRRGGTKKPASATGSTSATVAPSSSSHPSSPAPLPSPSTTGPVVIHLSSSASAVRPAASSSSRPPPPPARITILPAFTSSSAPTDTPSIAELSLADDKVEEDGKAKEVKLRYLPPLEVEVVLGEKYPVEEGPKVVLRDTVGWMEKEWTKTLKEYLEGLWTGEECLWMMVDFLSNADSLADLFGWSYPLTLTQSTLSSSSKTKLSDELKKFDAGMKGEAFDVMTFTCDLCLETKKGRNCFRFCLPCLTSYFTLLITEGLISSLHCPAVSCVKSRAELVKAGKADEQPGEVSKEELREIVGDELVKRWEWLKEKGRVESDPSIAYCPREACQAPVERQDDDEKLRICKACSYSFCVFCKRGWHGSQTPCSLPQSSAIVTRYLEGTDADRKELELRYGEKNVKRLVNVFEEDRMNREYMEGNSMGCPGCEVRIQKSQGCNHMHCTRCNTHFCFRCGGRLPGNPYEHFSVQGGSCYNKLFDFVPGNEPPPEEWLHLVDE